MNINDVEMIEVHIEEIPREQNQIRLLPLRQADDPPQHPPGGEKAQMQVGQQGDADAVAADGGRPKTGTQPRHGQGDEDVGIGLRDEGRGVDVDVGSEGGKQSLPATGGEGLLAVVELVVAEGLVVVAHAVHQVDDGIALLGVLVHVGVAGVIVTAAEQQHTGVRGALGIDDGLDLGEVVKVGDVFEFTIIQLDVDRRRIGLSLKSDAAGRAGTGQKSAPRRENSTPSGNGTGKRVVVVKKAGSGNSVKSNDYNKNRDNRSSSSSDDGMSYNPFAAFFNK